MSSLLASRLAEAAQPPLAEVDALSVSFPVRGGDVRDVVRGVSLSVRSGEALGIVGESGSGKSVTVRSLIGLAGRDAQIHARTLKVAGQDLTSLRPRAWRALRGRKVGFVLQDALVSLDPLRSIGAEVVEAIRAHEAVSRREAWARAVQLLAEVGIPDPANRARQYSHELSGGLRQRALIATAIAANPPLLIADEPTTALDVAVQLQILALLRERVEKGAGVILISHDIGLVERIADRVIVMRGGEVIEAGETVQVLRRPAQPYTRRLLQAIPSGDSKGYRLAVAEGAEAGAEPLRLAERQAQGGPPVLEVKGIAKSYRNADGSLLPAVKGVSFTISPGETVGLVGESGSGKSTVARMILGLTQPDAGEILLDGQPWSAVPERARISRRARIQIVTQDTLGVFDPRYTVADSIAEAIKETRPVGRAGLSGEIADLLDQVGLARIHLDKPLRALSGGERQRVAIARALATHPRLLVCDEPVSALDLSIQAQVLDLLWDLQARTGVSYLFISHDLGVVHHLSDRVLVMQGGAVVESGDADDIFARPGHPYTAQLVAALPRTRARWRSPPAGLPVSGLPRVGADPVR